MAVEKYQFLSHESVPYTMLSTYVIQNIDNGDAYLIWSYLKTNHDNSKINKQHLYEHFKFGRDKINKIFSYLARVKLIRYEKKRGKNGRIYENEIIALNGEEFEQCHLDINAKNNGINKLNKE